MTVTLFNMPVNLFLLAIACLFFAVAWFLFSKLPSSVKAKVIENMFSEKNLPRNVSDEDKLLIEKGELLLKPINQQKQKKTELIAVSIFIVFSFFMYFIDVELDKIKKNCEFIFGMLPEYFYLILIINFIIVGAICYIFVEFKRYKKSLQTGFRYNWKKRRKNHIVFVKTTPKKSKQLFFIEIAFVVSMFILLMALLIAKVNLQFKSLNLKTEFFTHTAWIELNLKRIQECKQQK